MFYELSISTLFQLASLIISCSYATHVSLHSFQVDKGLVWAQRNLRCDLSMLHVVSHVSLGWPRWSQWYQIWKRKSRIQSLWRSAFHCDIPLFWAIHESSPYSITEKGVSCVMENNSKVPWSHLQPKTLFFLMSIVLGRIERIYWINQCS